jgi:hypothetical protein
MLFCQYSVDIILVVHAIDVRVANINAGVCLGVRFDFYLYVVSGSFLDSDTNFIYTHVVKVKLSLCLTKHHAMKTYWGVEVQLHAFFSWALDGGE